MSNPLFTVILAVHRSPECLPLAVASVLAQHLDDFELYIICDGAPAETTVVAKQLAQEDPRVHVRSHPKGPRHGEIYRHQVLQETTGKYVAHIADDDLWMPHHLSELSKLLSDYDFGNLLHVFLDDAGVVKTYPYDLADEAVRDKMMTENFNFFGPTVAGYRRSVYEKLPVGWSPAPEEIHADLYMWRKLLALPNIKVGTRFMVTSLVLPTPFHGHKSLELRREEMSAWLQVTQSPDGPGFVQERLNAFFVKGIRSLNNECRRYRNLYIVKLAKNGRSFWKKIFR